MRTIIALAMALVSACAPIAPRVALSATALAAAKGQEAYDNYIARIETERATKRTL